MPRAALSRGGDVDRYANDLYLRKATVEYLGSAHYDDELEICCRVAKLGRSSMTLHFEIIAWPKKRRSSRRSSST